MDRWWQMTQGEALAQGDYLPRCLVPVLPSDYGATESPTVDFGEVDLVVVTQSCDLANSKVGFAALCAAYTIPAFQRVVTHYKNEKNFEEVRRGNNHALHLLAGLIDPADKMAALVVDFRQIYSLPVAYVRRHAGQLGERPRLNPPYLEHFSQAFARFFMRVGLPSSLPPYK